MDCLSDMFDTTYYFKHYVFIFLGGVGDSQRYLDEAEREKMQYAQELKEYQQTEAYQITSAKIHDKRIKKGDG